MVSPQLHRSEAMMKRNIPNEDTTYCLMASTLTARRYHDTQLQFQEKPFGQQPHATDTPLILHIFCQPDSYDYLRKP